MFTKNFTYLICLVIFSITIQAAPGDLATTFGSGGKVFYRFNDRTDSFHSVAVQPDGKILVAGINGSNQMIVLRYNSGGTLDSGFASGGVYSWLKPYERENSSIGFIAKVLQSDAPLCACSGQYA